MSPLLATAAALLLATTALWGLSVKLRDAGIVDIFWGLGFAVVAWTAVAVSGGPGPRPWLVAALVTVWALRLAGYLLWRNAGKPEDYRYQTIRASRGPGFWWQSLFVVFWLQGALIWFVSLPVQAAVTAAGPDRLGPLDAVGAALWAVGLFFEAVGDAQLARFKADPANKGQVMDRGLWRYTRHPNYFGDFCVWWGLYLLACSTPLGPYSALSPVVMTTLLLKVSGVGLLERTITERRPAYRDYIARTSAFFPWPPKNAR